jgi:hemin uptake protein HemP
MRDAPQKPQKQSAAEPRIIDATTLLEGQKCVVLTYANTRYQLKVTRLGKLILTK